MKQILTIEEAAKIAGVSSEVIQDLVACEDIPSFGSHKDLIRSVDLNNFLGVIPAQSPLDATAFPALHSSQAEEPEIGKEELEMATGTYGEGSVYRTARGYQAAFYLVLPEGTKKRKIVSGSTREEVIEKMEAIKEKIYTSNKLYQPSQSSVTGNPPVARQKVLFETVALEYLELAKQRNSVNTYRNKESMVRPLLDWFGNIPIDEIREVDVQRFLNEFKRFKGGPRNGQLRSQSSIRNTHTLLKTIFHYALKCTVHYIDREPLYGVVTPDGVETKKENRFFTEDELVKVFRAVLDHPKYKTIAVLALSTGLRGEEFTALQWSDINFKTGAIKVNKAMVVGESPTTGKKWGRVVGKTKTKSSNRVVYVGETTLKQLKEWHDIQKGSEAYNLASKEDANFVFLDDNGHVASLDHLRNNFKGYVERRCRIEKSCTFHLFRHSYATLARANGVDPFVIKAWMGHSTQEDITEGVYTSITDKTRKESVKIIDTFVSTILSEAEFQGQLEVKNSKR